MFMNSTLSNATYDHYQQQQQQQQHQQQQALTRFHDVQLKLQAIHEEEENAIVSGAVKSEAEGCSVSTELMRAEEEDTDDADCYGAADERLRGRVVVIGAGVGRGEGENGATVSTSSEMTGSDSGE